MKRLGLLACLLYSTPALAWPIVDPDGVTICDRLGPPHCLGR
jgi:hypothetical protein